MLKMGLPVLTTGSICCQSVRGNVENITRVGLVWRRVEVWPVYGVSFVGTNKIPLTCWIEQIYLAISVDRLIQREATTTEIWSFLMVLRKWFHSLGGFFWCPSISNVFVCFFRIFSHEQSLLCLKYYNPKCQFISNDCCLILAYMANRFFKSKDSS